jgi:L-asparagine transporter-like permease
LLTYINFVSVKLFVRVQNVFTVSKLVACLIVIISGIYVLCAGRYSVHSQVLSVADSACCASHPSFCDEFRKKHRYHRMGRVKEVGVLTLTV